MSIMWCITGKTVHISWVATLRGSLSVISKATSLSMVLQRAETLLQVVMLTSISMAMTTGRIRILTENITLR